MSENNEQLTQLLVTFRERDRLHQALTNVIFDMLKPTVLDALLELFDATPDNAEWDSAELSETALSVTCTIAHAKGTKVPRWVELLTPGELTTDQGDKIARFFRINLPIKHAFSSKEVIKQFLQTMIDQLLEEAGESVPEPASEPAFVDKTTFDASKLTQDQITQMLVFQHQSKGTKH